MHTPDTVAIYYELVNDTRVIQVDDRGARRCEQLRLTERFTRIDPERVNYEIRVEDPLRWEPPWTMRMTLTQQLGYEIDEYACHEGNISLERILRGSAPTRSPPPPSR
ncbi:MAG: hypothetical protein ABI640_15290 [Gammaproteobacteria bacterium]